MQLPLQQNARMPHARQRDLGCSLKEAKHMNRQTAKTLEDIEHAVKAVHTALACNRARVSRMTSFSSGETSPATTCCSSGSSTPQPQQRSLATARLVAKQAQVRAEPVKMDSESLRSMDSLGVTRRSLAEARAARKEEVCAEQRSDRYVGSLLAKLDDMQRIVQQ